MEEAEAKEARLDAGVTEAREAEAGAEAGLADPRGVRVQAILAEQPAPDAAAFAAAEARFASARGLREDREPARAKFQLVLRAAKAEALRAEYVALDTRCTEQQAAVHEMERRRQAIEPEAGEAALELQRLLDQRAVVSRQRDDLLRGPAA